MAVGLGVSCLVDNVARVTNPSLVSSVYPLSQAALVAIPVVSRREAALLVVTLFVVGLWSIAHSQGHGPDLALRIVGWGSIVVLAGERLPHGGLRNALVYYFAGSLLLWVAYVWQPGWSSWLAYQGARAVGIGWFLWAAWQARERQVACPTVR